MAEYVTLIEAAELEGVKYKTMAQRLNRNPDKFDTMTEKSENGGKDAVLVAVASLSKKARNAWKERAKLKELSGTISPEGEAQPEPEAPWYVEADVDWYIENYREQWYKGMELGNVIREFLQYDGANKTEYAEQYAQEHLGSGKRTLYRYVKAYNEACAWADKLQKESGVGFEFFKVLCLCRKPKESGTFPSIKPEVKQVIKNIWFNEDFAANLGTREMLYEKLTLVANVNKWEKIPSYQTVTRYITYLMEDEGMKNAHFLASKGSREYKNKVMVKGSRDTSGLKVMQIVMGDEHTFDCWVAYKQPNGKVTEVLWEEKLSYYDLMEVKISEGEASFNSELQNDPIDPDNATFNPEWFDYYEPELMDFTSPEFIFVGANDPSLGKNKKSDTSSIINLAVSLKSGYMYVVDASVEKRKPDVIIEDVFEMNRRLKRDCKKGFFKFGVETVQFQYYFKEVMAKKSAEEGEYLPIEEIQSSVNKVLRIESLQPLIKNKYIKFNREHKALLKQLQEFPMGKNDDAPDGLQMAVQTAQNVKGAAIKTSYKSIIRRRFRMGKGAY